MKRFVVFHHFFFALFFVLYLFSHNIEVASFNEVIFSLVVVLIFTLLLPALFILIFRDKFKAGILTTFFLILLFSYGHIYNFLLGQGLRYLHHRYLLLVWAASFTGGFLYIINSERKLKNLNKFLNVISFILLFFTLAQIGIYKLATRDFWSREVEVIQNRQVSPKKIDSRPDIFYIILDGYPNSNILKDLFGIDNQYFTNYLTKKGFYVVPRGHSNYVLTFLSLASSLNMQYINDFSNLIGEKSKDRAIPYKMIGDSAVVKFLKLQEYKFINISSGWGPTDYMQDADFNFRKTRLDEFTKLLISTTIFKPFMMYIAKDDKTIRLLYFVSILPKIERISGPKFVFAHIITQSLPRDQELEKLLREGSVSEKRLAALKYFTFINDNVEKAIDYLISASKIPPVIILQADHGTREIAFAHPGELQWDNLTDTMIRESTGILNAYYLPKEKHNFLYDSITPVNSFRLVFNLYFGTDHELLDDQSYYSTKELPYRFLKVTDRLKID